MVQVFREAETGRLSLADRVLRLGSGSPMGSGLLPYITTPESHDPRSGSVDDHSERQRTTDLLLKRVGAKNVTATLRQLGIQTCELTADRGTHRDWLRQPTPACAGVRAEFFAHPEKLCGPYFPTKRNALTVHLSMTVRDHTSPKAMADL